MCSKTEKRMLYITHLQENWEIHALISKAVHSEKIF